MLKVPSLSIPTTLPHPDAIRSSGMNQHNYDPELWEFQYETYKYLCRTSSDYLVDRYQAIVRNMHALISTERHVIPIQSFLSSWYWYRKEHQTRLEFYLRGMEVPVQPPNGTLNNTSPDAPAHPRSPNAGDVLFRYGKRQHMEAMVNEGIIRIGPASFYQTIEADAARSDVECTKNNFIPSEYGRIITQEGSEIPVRGDIKHSISAPNYFLLSMSCEWDTTLFQDFGADACIVVQQPNEFARRLETTLKQEMVGWYFHHNPVEYFDPYERIKNQYFDATMCKDFRFSYQREYRFLWIHTGGKEATDFKFCQLGSLADIAQIHLDD